MYHRDEALLDLKHLNEVLAVQSSLQHKYGDAFVQEKQKLAEYANSTHRRFKYQSDSNLIIDHRGYSFPVIRKHEPDSRVLLSRCS